MRRSVSFDLPETPEGLVQYLAKHPAFTGIGETTARKIVSYVASAEHLDRVIRQDIDGTTSSSADSQTNPEFFA